MGITHLSGLAVSGTTTLQASTNASSVTATTARLEALAISSAANAWCGKRRIITAATTKYSIATTKVRSSSRIFLTTEAPIFSAKTRAVLGTIGSGVSFSVKLTFGQIPTGATGTVHWMLVNI